MKSKLTNWITALQFYDQSSNMQHDHEKDKHINMSWKCLTSAYISITPLLFLIKLQEGGVLYSVFMETSSKALHSNANNFVQTSSSIVQFLRTPTFPLKLILAVLFESANFDFLICLSNMRFRRVFRYSYNKLI